MESYKPVWLKGAIILAINLANAGYKPVAVGLGERDFYVDIQSETTLSLDEVEKLIKVDNFNPKIDNNQVEYNGIKIKIEANESIPA
ncbi:MAG: threonine--tRNA ligase, partial [Saccharolobus sp.]